MRYLKSAALLLLTASSSASLLSAVAKAEQGIQDSNTQERVDTSEQIDTSQIDTSQTVAGSDEIAMEALSPEGQAASSESIMTPIVDEMHSPRFDLLRARLLSDTAQALPVEVAARLTEAELAEPELTASNTNAPLEPLPNEPILEAAATEKQSRAEIETATENFVAIEVIDNTELPLIGGQPDSFIPAPKMTLDSFRELVEAEQNQNESTLENAAENVSDSTAQLAQAETTDSLPVLEDTEPEAVEPEAETVEEERDPLEVEPPAAPPSSADETEASDETEATPPAESTGEIEGLPDSLFADPNPLSFPTQESEVDVDQNPVVTLEQAIALAYQNNQTLQASLLSLEQAEAGVDAARAARLPTVDLGSTLSRSQGLFEDDSPGGTTQNDDARTTLNSTVEVEYDVLTGGSREATIRAAELQRDVSALTVETQQEQIRLAAASAYYDLQDAGEQIRINQSFVDEATRNLRDAQLRQEVGVGTRFDTLRAEVQFANARQALIQSQGSQRIARRDISRLLNLPPTAGLTATPVQVAETWPLTLEESILLAFQNRAELEQQLLQADISEQQRRQALAAIRPQLSVFANYSPINVLEGASDFENEFQDSVAFGARLSWRLYDGGAARAQARQQEIGSAIAEEQFSENLDQVRFDVEQAYFNLETNQENILTSQVAVAQAEEALSLANLRLQAGVGTQLDVLTAQSELTEAEGNNVAAILGYNRALVSIERAISNVATPF